MKEKLTVIKKINPQPERLLDSISWKNSDWCGIETGYISVLRKCPIKKINKMPIKTKVVFEENGVFYWGLTA